MNLKASNKNTNKNPHNPKNNQSQNPIRKKRYQSNKEDLKPISLSEKEISKQSFISNKSQIYDLNVKEKIKISVIEKDSFPHNNLKLKENYEIDLYNLVHLLQNIEEAKKDIEEEILQNQQNKLIKDKENKSDKNNNLKEITDTIKLKLEEKIKNYTDNKNEDNKEEKRREEKRREELKY